MVKVQVLLVPTAKKQLQIRIAQGTSSPTRDTSAAAQPAALRLPLLHHWTVHHRPGRGEGPQTRYGIPHDLPHSYLPVPLMAVSPPCFTEGERRTRQV